MLRQLMQNRLVNHFTKLRQDLRIELMAETSEKDGCVVCFMHSKTHQNLLPNTRIGPDHGNIFKDLVIKCAIRYVYLIRLKNKLKGKVRRRRRRLPSTGQECSSVSDSDSVSDSSEPVDESEKSSPDNGASVDAQTL